MEESAIIANLMQNPHFKKLNDMNILIIMLLGLIMLAFLMMLWLVSRFIKCPPDKLLVVYGRVENGHENGIKVLNGGAAFVWPVIQDYEFIDLSPYNYRLDSNVLTKDNIEINVTGEIGYGVSNQSKLMKVAATRLLGISSKEIEHLGANIIGSQLTKIFKGQDVVDIAALRGQIIEKIAIEVNNELNKIGLYLINIKLDKINDKNGFIKQLEQGYNAQKVLALNTPEVDDLLSQLNSIDRQIERNTQERERLLKQKLALLVKHKI